MNTTLEREDQQIQDQPSQDQAGSLAESARRHIAYERLARQVAASEAAARLVLDALARRGRAADSANDSGPTEGAHE